MASEFVTARYPEGTMPRVHSQAQMVARVKTFMPPGVRARVREVGGEWTRWLLQPRAIDRILNRVTKMGVGPKLIVQRESDRDMLSIREVSLVPDLGAAPEIEKIHAAVWNKFKVRSGGLWYCRYIDGTRTVSKHGYLTSSWKGAAEDIFVLSGGMPALINVADFIVTETRAKRLKAATVIVDQDIWTPASGWRVYGGQRHYHAHTDVTGGGACRP